MTGKTHRVGGMLGGLLSFSILQSQGMLSEEISQPLQLVMMYSAAMYGSVVSDIDHEWDSCPCKDIFSWFFWKMLHLATPIRRFLKSKGKFRRLKIWIYKHTGLLLDCFDSKHRSWQTHSDLSLILPIVVLINIKNIISGELNGLVLGILLTGFCSGLLSHLILDLLTPEGIWSFLLTPFKLLFSKKKGGSSFKDYLAKLHLVPNKSFFAVKDNESLWEYAIRKLMWLVCFCLVIRFIYLLQPYRLFFD